MTVPSTSDGAPASGTVTTLPLITVVLATPVRLYREGLDLALRHHPKITVVGGAGTAEEVADAVAGTRPDVLVADSTLVLVPGLLDRVRLAHAPLRVVAIGLGDDLSAVVDCAAAGASGYVSRDARAAELAAVVSGVLTGELTCSASVAALLLHRLIDRAPDGASRAGLRSVPPLDPPAAGLLSDRERQVAALVAEGLMNKQIARRLGLSISTVKNHVHSILGKQGLTSRLELGPAGSRDPGLAWIPVDRR